MKAILTRLLFVFLQFPLFFLFGVNLGQAQVISVEELIESVSLSKSVEKAFSYQFENEVAGYLPGEKYFAARTADDLNIFDAKGRVQNLANSESAFIIRRFLDNRDLFFADMQKPDGRYECGLFHLDGTPAIILPFFIYNVSPGGRFFYHECTGDGSAGEIPIYDENGDRSFGVPNGLECQVTAPSDSQLIVFQHETLSLWDVKAKQTIWVSDIPGGDCQASSMFKITYSVDGNIIVVRDQNSWHCFDFQGNFLWAHRPDGGKRRGLINMVGVCREDGRIVVTVNEGNSIEATIFSRRGDLLDKPRIELGPNCHFSANVSPLTADFSGDFVLLPFQATHGDIRMRVTGILYYDGSKWTSAAIEGAWYVLNYAKSEYTLIGFSEIAATEIKAFTMKQRGLRNE